MPLSLDRLHARVRKNTFLKIFTVVTRILLALAFLPSGITKALGNHFTMLGLAAFLNGIIGHALLVGLPIALLNRRSGRLNSENSG